MRRSLQHPNSRRRGQALLLAVLIMIFAALLSAAFISIVAVNLNQTQRQGDTNLALDNANAGVKYVNDQLTYSRFGENWKPAILNKPTAPNEVGDEIYYSAFDLAHGWRGYSKFPDPRADPTAGPNFLVNIERVPFNTPSSSPDFDKIGALKVTVIGLSPDDPTAFKTRVFYKGGMDHAPVGQVMRTISGYDFNADKTLAATFDGSTDNGTSTTLGVMSATGDFSKLGVPFTITVSNPVAGTAATGGVVTSVTANANNSYKFTLAKPLAIAAAGNAHVDLAANIGGRSTIDDNVPSTPQKTFFTSLFVSDTDNTSSNVLNEVDGVYSNVGLIWSGDLSAPRLRAPSSSYSTLTASGYPYIPGTIKAASVMTSDLPTPAATAIPVPVQEVNGATTYTVIGSRSSGVFSATGVDPVRDQLVGDAWDRLRGVPAAVSTRAVAEFKPPVIDKGASLARYRDLARNSNGVGAITTATSQAITGASNNGPQYGFGSGIYIDNTQDKEKVLDGTTLREMTQTELVQMWQSQLPPAVTAIPSYFRTGSPVVPATPAPSLEQMHLRGWVGPDEFRARGVEIELGNNQITITRDAREDGTYYAGGSPNKAWIDPATGVAKSGVYTQVLPWPTNGVLFAEGNIRIKGDATFVPNSLTVVSMGNIYIEDSLSADDMNDGDAGLARKILLVAKKNVVMNPTRVMGRPDAQTLAAGGPIAAGMNQSLAVADGASFRVGDFIQASSAPNVYEMQGYVTAVAPSALTLTVTRPGTVGAAEIISTPNVSATPITSSSVTSITELLEGVTQPTDVIQRRISIPLGATAADLARLRLVFDHQAQRIAALNVKTNTVPLPNDSPYTQPIYFANKGVFKTPPPTVPPLIYLDYTKSNSAQTDDKLQIQRTGPDAAGNDIFPATVPANKAAADLETISKTSADMNAVKHEDTVILVLPEGWQYETSVATAGYGPLPFYYLAGVGNRLDYGTSKPIAPVVDERRKQINPLYLLNPTTGYDVPLATSIGVAINGAMNPVYNETWNATTTNFDLTHQFGFSPFLDVAPNPADEDILTSDQSFYQGDILRSTIDSRSANNVTLATNSSALLPGSNSLVLRMADGMVPLATGTTYPSYLLHDAKVEDITLATGGSSIITGVRPGHTFNVKAYVYAQTGSWFVISVPTFDDRLRGDTTRTFLDLNNDGLPQVGEFEKGIANTANPTTWEVGDFADLNRDGTVEAPEMLAMLRYPRYNYEINFLGAIAENQTALVSNASDGTNTNAVGAVSSWMDKMATVTFDPTNTTNPVKYDRIKYIFDPTYAQGQMNYDPTAPGVHDIGFLMPQSSDIFNLS